VYPCQLGVLSGSLSTGGRVTEELANESAMHLVLGEESVELACRH
jgi:hypothetical protein